MNSWALPGLLWQFTVLVALAEEKHANGGHGLQVPSMLDCEGDGWSEEWRNLRLAATEAVARGFERSAALEVMAANIEEKWRRWICPRAQLGELCHNSGDLGFDFVAELHRECRDSKNFERYLLRHYFRNTETTYAALKAPSGFCLYGYVTALTVLAWHRLPVEAGYALRYIYMARHLLGHYHSFDFLESSSWPVSSFLVLVNYNVGGVWLPQKSPPDYALPGQSGPAFYYDRLSWQETAEAAKALPSSVPFRLPGLRDASGRPRIVIWQFCIHASTAGEAVTMITRFQEDYDVEFRGNSLAVALCRNYRPMICAEGRNLEFLEWMLEAGVTMPFPELSKRFQEEMLPQLAQADVWMCSIPAIWCWLLWDAAKSSAARSTPIFAYIGLPVLQAVQQGEREQFLEALVTLGKSERNILVANNAYLAEEVAWQTGLRIPTLRIHGLHTNATYFPIRNSEVLISRPGTSGGWQECVLQRFVDANPTYTLRFVQFTNLLNPDATEEVYNESLSYRSLSEYRAVVGFPYDTSLMFFWEFYSMNMPFFVPLQLWHWGIFGQHTRPDLGEAKILAGEGAQFSLVSKV